MRADYHIKDGARALSPEVAQSVSYKQRAVGTSTEILQDNVSSPQQVLQRGQAHPDSSLFNVQRNATEKLASGRHHNDT